MDVIIELIIESKQSWDDIKSVLSISLQFFSFSSSSSNFERVNEREISEFRLGNPSVFHCYPPARRTGGVYFNLDEKHPLFVLLSFFLSFLFFF